MSTLPATSRTGRPPAPPLRFTARFFDRGSIFESQTNVSLARLLQHAGLSRPTAVLLLRSLGKATSQTLDAVSTVVSLIGFDPSDAVVGVRLPPADPHRTLAILSRITGELRSGAALGHLRRREIKLAEAR